MDSGAGTATASASAKASSSNDDDDDGGCPVKPDLDKCSKAAQSFAKATADASAAASGDNAVAKANAAASAGSSDDYSGPCFKGPYNLAINKCGSVSAPTFVPLFVDFCTGKS